MARFQACWRWGGRGRFVAGVLVVGLALVSSMPARPLCAAEPGSASPPTFVDLSLLVAQEYPANWPAPGFAPFHLNHDRRIGPQSAYNTDILAIDGNTGTQLDVPPHSIPHPDSKLPNAGPAGLLYTHKIPAWQFCGEACVVDCRDLVESGKNGQSPLVTQERVAAWEKRHRPLACGDVVLFHSGYSDKFYEPLPAGRRFVAQPVEGTSPAWPDPDPECMEYVASRGVMAAGTDSASMGPLPELAEPTHLAGLKHGMIWAESATNLGALPPTGAFYCLLSPKHTDGPYAEARALAITGNPLAARLIESARKKQVVDLSVRLATELPVWWPGPGSGNHRQPYLTIPLFPAPNLGTYHTSHLLDSTVGTHLIPPSFALPPAGFDDRTYPREVQGWLAEYEQKFGPRGTSDVTAEQVPLSATCGEARVIDVRSLRGTTKAATWPQSPEITVATIQDFEKQHGPLRPGEIVIFHSGYSDEFCQPFPAGNACLADPLNGKREGWPAPGPEAIQYLAKQGIRCVATDGPTLGGSEPKRALLTYWALGSYRMLGVEYLTGVSQLPPQAYFIFAPIKVKGCHGGPGRAIALY
ncbi:MAG: cyclase family protein [Planctomycetaceae bacterium]|nr:cyclase family protein [Planctomycetaceae bacterium]